MTQDNIIEDYLAARKQMQDEHGKHQSAEEAVFAERSQEVERLALDIKTKADQVNKATLEFIRFFIENTADLSAELQEYVAAWQKENVGTFGQLAKLRDDLKTALKGQYEAGNKAAHVYEVTQTALFEMTENFQSMIKVKLPEVVATPSPLPL